MSRSLVLVPILALMACNGAGAETGKPTGVAGSRSFEATGFDAVELAGADDVVVRVGPAFSVTATGDQALLDALEVKVAGKALEIRRKKGFRWTGNDRARVTVTLPAMRAASLAGSGNMSVEGAAAPAFEGSLAGSGNLSLGGLKAERAALSIAGSGNIDVAGTARDASLSIAGSGDIRAGQLSSGTVDVSIAGSGNILAAATGRAKVSIMGSGDVTVKGTNDCSVTKMGSGRVTCGA